MKLFVVFSTFLLFSITPNKDVSLDYINANKFMAIEIMNQYGINASVVLAQAILESRSGSSELAVKANNHFGIKCKSYWQGETILQHDDDVDNNGKLIESCFRKYPSIMESYHDYGRFISNHRSYKYMKEDDYSYVEWAYALELNNYATIDGYAERIINIIENYSLAQYDEFVFQSPLDEFKEKGAETKESNLELIMRQADLYND